MATPGATFLSRTLDADDASGEPPRAHALPQHRTRN